ncbi:MAG: hypothetical protein WAU39_12765 [Polyangiales bacterium]
MSFEQLYASPIQHPWLLWASALLGLLVALSKRGLSRQVRAFCVALTVLSLLDAWLTADSVLGVGPLEGVAASLVPLLFVLLGDFRYFFLIEAARADGTLAVGRTTVAIAAAWTSVVPIGSQLVVHAIGSEEPRVLFLVYETLFVMLSLGLYAAYLPRHARAVRWTRRVTLFVLIYYGSWAFADAVILHSSADAGFLVRMLPNVLYYGGFVPAVAWTAPRAAPK